MKYEKAKNGSYLHNCLIEGRKDSPPVAMLTETEEGLVITLNGYAIIPLEKYAELTGEDYSAMITAAKEADAVLRG